MIPRKVYIARRWTGKRYLYISVNLVDCFYPNLARIYRENDACPDGYELVPCRESDEEHKRIMNHLSQLQVAGNQCTF